MPIQRPACQPALARGRIDQRSVRQDRADHIELFQNHVGQKGLKADHNLAGRHPDRDVDGAAAAFAGPGVMAAAAAKIGPVPAPDFRRPDSGASGQLQADGTYIVLRRPGVRDIDADIHQRGPGPAESIA